MGSVIWIPVFFASATAVLYLIATSLPSTGNNDMSALKFPSSIEDLSAMSTLLNSYKEQHLGRVLLLCCSAYLYKQTFAIPGSVFMNVLSGALFGVWMGFPLVCLLTATGASFCYLLSRHFGKHYVIKMFPEKVKNVQEKVAENQDSLLFFLLFLRFFPMSPNWFMNIAAPIVGIPLPMFFVSVFIGLMPYNYICVQTGSMLSSVESLDDIFSVATTVKLLLIAVVALVPAAIIKRLKSQREQGKLS